MSKIKPLSADTSIEAVNTFKSLNNDQLVDVSHLLQRVCYDICWEIEDKVGSSDIVESGFAEVLETIGDILTRRMKVELKTLRSLQLDQIH